MTLSIDGLPVHLVEAEDRIVFHTQNPDHSGSYEPDSLLYWARSIKPDTVVVDVGSYTGLFAIIAAMRGARVTALEPMPANAWRTRVNAGMNKVQVTVLAVAASDYEGTATLHYNPKVPLTTGASLEDKLPNHRDKMVVRCITIDSLGLENVSAMKIDVEWHEPCVIRGAMQTISRDRPSLLIETLDNDMRDRILDLLPSYEAAAILDTRNTLFTPR